VWLLAGPIILSNISVPLVGAVDTAVVGHLPDPVYIGAVAIGALIFSFLFYGFGFLRMGTTGFVAQAHGANDSAGVAQVLVRALLMAGAFGLVLVILQHPLSLVSFWLLEGGEQLEALADDYFRVRVWSAPATLGNYAVLGFLIGLQNTRAALVLQLVLNVSNVILDLFFVLELGWGVEGVAVASVISEYLALATGLVICRRMLPDVGSGFAWKEALSIGRFMAMLHVNLNIFIRTVCLLSAFALFTARGTGFGEIILASNAVLLHLQHILAYGLDGFAHAVEALAGSAYGARNRAAYRSSVYYTTIWALLVALLFAAVFYFFGEFIVSILTGIDVVRENAVEYLPWLIISPVISVWSYQLDGIFIGTTRTVDMRNAMVLSLVAYLIAVWLIVPVWGNHGLWFCLMLFMAVRALTLGIRLPAIAASLN